MPVTGILLLPFLIETLMNSPDQSVDALRIYGNLSLLEMAPVLLAAEQIYAGRTIVEHGSVMALWGQSSDLASLNSSGQADLATNSDTQTLRGTVAGPDLRVIFTVAECPYRIIARRSAGIATLADLRGKRVATQLDSSGAYFLDRMLRTAGLTSADVASVPFMAHTDSPLSLVPEALSTGRIDAVALWEPQPQRAKVALGDDAIEFANPAVYTEKFNLSTSRAKLEDPVLRPRIVAFVRALMIAAQRLRKNPQAGQEIVARTAHLDADTVRGAWTRFNYPGTLAPDVLDVYERQEPWLANVQNRAPRNRATLAQFIDDSVVREAKSL